MRRAALLLPCVFLAACVPWTVRPLQPEQQASSGKFDPARFADQVWTSKLIPALDAAAVEARPLFSSGALQPGRHAAVRGAAIVLEVRAAQPSGALVLDLLPADGRADALLQTGPDMRGSALRDATTAISFSQFVNQIDFANAATELNRRAARALPPLDELKKARGRTVEFTGAVTFVAGELPAIVPVRFRWSGNAR